MSAITEQQAEELIAAATAMQTAHADLLDADPDLAENFRAYLDRLAAIRDGKIRSEGMRVIGGTHLAISEGLKRLEDRIAGYHQDMAAWRTDVDQETTERDRLLLRLEAALAGFTGAMQQQEAAVHALRAEFHDGVSALGERLTGVEATMGEHTAQITKLTTRVDGHDVRLDTNDAALAALQQQIARLLERAHALGVDLGYDHA